MSTQSPSPNTGPFAHASESEKKKRLDAMVSLWQSETEQRCQRENIQTLIKALGLDEYRYSVWLRFPEWERGAVVGQVLMLPEPEAESVESVLPMLFSAWRHDPLLQHLPDWKRQLPHETVFNISVRITPGSLGEGMKWAVVMPKEMIPRYRPGWPTQQEWVAWTSSFDWLSVGVGFIRLMLDSL